MPEERLGFPPEDAHFSAAFLGWMLDGYDFTS
jgi:hypothetical protein